RNNTNAAEAVHAYANYSRKQLKGRKLDKTTISQIKIYTKFGIPVTQHDNGEIKCKAAAMTCKSAVIMHKKTEAVSNKKPKIESESNNLHELEIEE
ncbi:15144_t:CDS:2, partial [Gigaspora margarita]